MTDRPVQTKDFLEKIPNFPCLYRHSVNGLYYGIKKVSGKKKSHSLDTADRKMAERLLKDWIKDLDRIDTQSQVDHKLISKWQGQQDGGKLILDTYTEVFSSKPDFRNWMG